MSPTSEIVSNPSSSSANPPKNVPWTYDENDILLMRVQEYIDSRGRPRWAQVAKGLPGRTAQEARCRYRRISDAELRRKRGESFRNKCHTCGQLRRGHVCPGVTVESRALKLAAAQATEVQKTALADPVTEGTSLPDTLILEPLRAVPHEELQEEKQLEDNFEKLEVSVGDIGSFEGVEEADSFPALPNSIQRSPSIEPLNEWLSKLQGPGPAAPPSLAGQLQRMPSMTNYIEAFFNAEAFLGEMPGGMSSHAPFARQSSSLIEVM